MLELSQRRTVESGTARRAAESRQRRNLLIALSLLMVALFAVLFTDRQFWFGADHSKIESDMPETATAAKSAQTPTTEAHKVPAVPVKKQISGTQKAVSSPVNSKAAAPKTANDQPTEAVVTGNRVVLPPMDVEVVAGDKHRVVRPGSNAAQIEITGPGRSSSVVREPLSAAALRQPQSSYSATYPLLAQHMNVQGSVVLQAIIGTDGVVQNLRVVSGPSILTPAAQQAVREWKFKPIIQNGQAVESKATITVNFTIKVADTAPSTTVAESIGSDNLTVTR
jgi:TonB family protein